VYPGIPEVLGSILLYLYKGESSISFYPVMKTLTKRFNLIVFLLCFPVRMALGWGFFAHKQINRHAVFTLPPAMLAFYKAHIHFITENAVNPDKRRYVVEGEAARHYIDLEHYSDSVPWEAFPYWSQALDAYTQDELVQHGILPWHICRMKYALTEAFQQKNVYQILRLSADIGHYIADANVPLHTSENYDGQLTGQEGIHGFWETRLPELFANDYNFLVGKASYVDNPQKRAWQAILTAHKAVEAVLRVEKKLSQAFPTTQKYSFERRGSTLQKVYARAYAQAYHNELDGQVEQQMRASIKMVGDFWLTCWVDAGQPDLDALLQLPLPQEELQEDFSQKKKLKVRTCGCQE
jgi:hypothetical protein